MLANIQGYVEILWDLWISRTTLNLFTQQQRQSIAAIQFKLNEIHHLTFALIGFQCHADFCFFQILSVGALKSAIDSISIQFRCQRSMSFQHTIDGATAYKTDLPGSHPL